MKKTYLDLFALLFLPFDWSLDEQWQLSPVYFSFNPYSPSNGRRRGKKWLCLLLEKKEATIQPSFQTHQALNIKLVKKPSVIS